MSQTHRRPLRSRHSRRSTDAAVRVQSRLARKAGGASFAGWTPRSNLAGRAFDAEFPGMLVLALGIHARGTVRPRLAVGAVLQNLLFGWALGHRFKISAFNDE
jgi:hypothetical protein